MVQRGVAPTCQAQARNAGSIPACTSTGANGERLILHSYGSRERPARCNRAPERGLGARLEGGRKGPMEGIGTYEAPSSKRKRRQGMMNFAAGRRLRYRKEKSMSKEMIMDEDSQVIRMVNTNTAYRRRKAEEAMERREIREEDLRAQNEDFRARKEKLCRALECAGKAALGLAFVAAARAGWVVGWMGLALAAVCLIWAAASWKRGRV